MKRDTTETLRDEHAAAPVALPASGSVVAGRYELARELGRGGYGVVFEAFDRELGRTLALKAMRADRGSAVAERRFRREVLLMRAVLHPNLVRLFDFGSEADFVFLTMELVRGESLAARLARTGPLAVDETVTLAAALVQGLGALHEAGIVHRDVKPSNVLIPEGEPGGLARVRLSDLGVARRLDSEEAHPPTGPAMVGTLGYLAPEVVRGARARPASDLFSLGLTLADALLGRDRREHDDALAAALTHLRPVPWARELARLRPETPPWLAEWIERLLQPAPEQRYPSAREASRDLESRRTPRPQLGRWLRRR